MNRVLKAYCGLGENSELRNEKTHHTHSDTLHNNLRASGKLILIGRSRNIAYVFEASVSLYVYFVRLNTVWSSNTSFQQHPFSLGGQGTNTGLQVEKLTIIPQNASSLYQSLINSLATLTAYFRAHMTKSARSINPEHTEKSSPSSKHEHVTNQFAGPI
jgi:hypothetical protein